MVCAESESALAWHWSGSNAACSPDLHDPWHSYVFVSVKDTKAQRGHVTCLKLLK